MKNFKQIFAASFLVALLSIGSYAQQQGAQTLSTTTLGAAVTSTSATAINLASLTNVTATASIQTVIWVDTEAMTVVTGGVPSTGNYVHVTRGTNGTKAETHASGRTVYVGRPNLYQGYDVAGTCTAGSGLAYVLPWINTSNGKRFQCLSGGEWILVGSGSTSSAAVTAVSRFCTGVPTSAQTEFLNDAACAGATTSTGGYIVTTAGEAANLRVNSTVAETAAAGDAVTLFKNGVATAVTCTIILTGTTCSDITHSVAVANGDRLSYQIVAATSAAVSDVSATVGIYNQ